MKYFIHIFALLSFLTSLTSVTFCAELNKISKSNTKNTSQLFFFFDTPPRFTTNVTGKRVDITFENSGISKQITYFDPDDRIIKFLSTTKSNNTTISIYLRYHPRKINSVVKDKTVVLDITIGNQFTKAYTDFAAQIDGAVIVERKQTDYSNPYITSPYVNNWKYFIHSYEPELSVSYDVQFSLPPFPIISMLPPLFRENETLLPDDALTLAEEGHWASLIHSIEDRLLTTTDIEEKKKLALTYGEVLLRNGNFENSFKQLYLLRDKYNREQLGILASYLLSMLRSIYEDPYIGKIELEKIKDSVHPKSPLAPYYLLSRVESALKTEHFETVQSLLLENSIGLPPEIQKGFELRHGDYLTSKKLYIKAFVTYSLLDDKEFIAAHPHSQSLYCSILYRQNKYQEASACFSSLHDFETDIPKRGMANYIKAMADLRNENLGQSRRDFSRIEDAFPDTDASFKAAMKLLDMKTLAENRWDEAVAEYYHEIATDGVTKLTSEEASFKEAITYHIMGNNSKAIQIAQHTLREYKFGNLGEHIQAFLIELIPDEIIRLVKEEKFFEALILAKQNKYFFEKNWLDISLLSSLAFAYNEVGIYKEAEKMYLYLIEVLPEKEKDKYYLPLIRSIFTQGDFDLVENYGEHYLFNIPQGKDARQIRLLYLKALFAEKKFDEALSNLIQPLPDDIEYTKFGASLYYHTGKYEEVIQILAPFFSDSETESEISKGNIEQFMLADSYFELGQFEKAKNIFIHLIDDPNHGQQTMYRLAKIEEFLGNKEASLNFLQRLVETEKDSPWKKAADKELKFNLFSEEFSKTRERF